MFYYDRVATVERSMKMTTNEFRDLAEKYASVRTEINSVKDLLSKKNAELEKLESEIIQAMEDLKMPKFHIDDVGTISIYERQSIRVPKLPHEKEAFAAYLKEINEYEALVTYNSQTLNSWYKQKSETASESGQIFAPPGLELPTTFKQISLRKG